MQSSFEIFKKSLNFYQNNFTKLFLVLVPFLLLWIALRTVLNLSPNNQILLATLLVLMITNLWSRLIIFNLIKNNDFNYKLTDHYTKTYHLILGLFLVNIFSGLVIIGGFALLIIPGLILSIYLSFCGFIYFFENLEGFKAIEKSWQYVKGRWFEIFVKVLFISLSMSFLRSAISSIAKTIFAEKYLQDIASEAISQLFISPLSLIYLYFLYLNVRSAAEDQVIDKNSIIDIREKLKILTFIGFAAALLITFFALKNPQFVKESFTKAIERTRN